MVTITASPPELPPHVRLLSYGFVVVPQIGFAHSNDSRVYHQRPSLYPEIGDRRETHLGYIGFAEDDTTRISIQPDHL